MKIIYTILFLFFATSIFAQEYYQVITSVLNVRNSANKNSEIISKLNLGDSIYVTNYSNGWSQIKLGDGNYGYVSSRYLSKDFQAYSKSSTTAKQQNKTSVWSGLGILIFIFLSWFLGSSKSKSSSNTNQSNKKNYSKPIQSPQIKNELISQVKLEDSWYRVYNPNGKQLSKKLKHSSDYLLGYGDKIVLLEEGSWYRLYDCNFKQISVKAVHTEDRFVSVAGNTITFQEGIWIRTYDTKFKQMNARLH